MKRSQTKFPLQADIFLEFLKNMWEQGWLDDYSDDHFLIKAMENRLTDFWGKQQAYLDNTVVFPVINEKNFVPCFLMNFSAKLGALYNAFGKEQIKKFVIHQLAAGKRNYQRRTVF